MAYYNVAYSSRDTIENTKYFTDVVFDTKIPGVLVECGVAAGAQIAAMQDRILKRYNNGLPWIYGFDSFEGIPLASEEDDQQPGVPGPKPEIRYTDKRELLKSSGITVHSKENVQASIKQWFPNNWNNIVLVKGWFQNTLPQYAPVLKMLNGISLLRLDGDLYESTKVSLENLFPLMNPGAILIVDDWDLAGCRRACEEYFADHPVERIDPPYGDGTGPAYFTKS
jgi:hypothetical protein